MHRAPRPLSARGPAPRLAACTATLAGLLLAGGAHAYTMGIPGKSIEGCGGAGCHAGGAEPTVVLMTPGRVSPGATVQLVLGFRDAGAAVGGDISAQAGVLQPAEGGALRAVARELVHNGMAIPTADGFVEIPFLWTAPEVAGPVTLFAAGNSVNLDRLPSGDAFSVTSATIEVAPEGGAGGAGGAGGGPSGVDAGAGGAGGGSGGTGGAAAPSGGSDDGGCRASGTPAGASLWALVLGALLLRRRRRA